MHISAVTDAASFNLHVSLRRDRKQTRKREIDIKGSLSQEWRLDSAHMLHDDIINRTNADVT